MPKISLCPYCGREMRGHRRAPTVDHVTPRALGGRLDGGNRLIVCRVCNGDKGPHEIASWHAFLTLAKDPRAPRVGRVVRAKRETDAAWPDGGGDLAALVEIADEKAA